MGRPGPCPPHAKECITPSSSSSPWGAEPLFNLLLRLNCFGRLALSREQIVAFNWIGRALGAGTVAAIALRVPGAPLSPAAGAPGGFFRPGLVFSVRAADLPAMVTPKK